VPAQQGADRALGQQRAEQAADEPGPPEVAVVGQRAGEQHGADAQRQAADGRAERTVLQALGPEPRCAMTVTSRASTIASSQPGASRKARSVRSKSIVRFADANAPAASAGRNGRMPAASASPRPVRMSKIVSMVRYGCPAPANLDT
jgi:hypothetical protein